MSIFDILPWWTWLIGTLGLVGTVFAIVGVLLLFPTLAAPIIAKIGARLAGLFVSIVKTPIGAALVAGLMAYTLATIHTAHVAAVACEASIEKMKADAAAAAVTRDGEIRDAIEKQYRPAMDALDQRAAELKQQVDDYERLSGKRVGKCALSPGALRLRAPR
jgi:hypothetical protein